jgi:hypothetical protein
MNTSNPFVLNPAKTPPGQRRRPGLPAALMRRWRGLLSGAVFLLATGGPAPADIVTNPVTVVNWSSGQWTVANNVGAINGFDLNDNANVLVIGVYVDNSGGFTSITFGGVPPDGYMNVNAVGSARMGVFYWLNPNTTPGQDFVAGYSANNAGYYFVYQLAGVDTTAAVAQSGSNVTAGTTCLLTNTADNSFVVSFQEANNAGLTMVPGAPLTIVDTTLNNLGGGASMASATNTAATAGIQTNTWTGVSGANQGVAALGFAPPPPGSPAVFARAVPSSGPPGQTFTVSATVTPGSGNVTNVTVDLGATGGAAANDLLPSPDPNVWTNTFIIPGGSPLGPAKLRVTATQDTSPFTGIAYATLTVFAPLPPSIVKDTAPTNFFFLYEGQGLTFSASFTGPQPISYSWQVSVDGGFTFTDIPGATNTTFTIPGFGAGDQGFYQLQASNQFGVTLSTYTYVQLNSGTPTYLWSAPIPFVGLNAEQILTNFPANNKIAGAMVAKNGGDPITVVLTNANHQSLVFAGAGNWASLAGGAGYGGGANTNQTGNAGFNTCLNDFYFDNATHTISMSGLVVGQQYQAQLFALDNRSGNGGRLMNYQDPSDPADLVQNMAMGDNVYVLGTFTATNSVMRIQQNVLSGAGNFNALVLRTVGWDPPPYFTIEPVNRAGFLGTNITFNGTAAGDSTIAVPTITYQWRAGPAGGPYTDLVEGAKYAGTTTGALTISNLVDADADVVYVLAATDGAGTSLSKEAPLLVQSPPIPPLAGSYGALALAYDPVGYWQLNETNSTSGGLLLAVDFSGHGLHGTYGAGSLNGFNGVLAPQPPDYGGFATNQGALHSGPTSTSDNTSVVSLPPLNITNINQTICMWIYPNSQPGNSGGLFMTRNAGNTDAEGLGFAAGPSGGMADLGYVWNNNQTTWGYNSPILVPNNTWSFVALVITANQDYLYCYTMNNGVPTFQSVIRAYTAALAGWNIGNIWIGGDMFGNGAGRIFPGRISGAAIYQKALSYEQILDLFAAGIGVPGFAPTFSPQPPTNTISYAGYTAQISAAAGGNLPLTNQWQFNGTNLADGTYDGTIITGATSNVLTITGISTNWQGVYNLIAANAYGSAVSSNAYVTVELAEAPPAANLVGQWFAGAPSLADVSGHAPAGTHDGTLSTNGGTMQWSSDLPPGGAPGGSALQLNNAGIIIGNTSTNDTGYESTFDVAISNAMTVTCWAKGWPGAWNPFVCKYGETTPSPTGGWQLRNDGNNNLSPCWTLRGGGGTVTLGTAVFGNAEDMAATSLTYGNDGRWHFYCGTYDVATGIRSLYVDGVLAAQVTGNGQYATAPLNHLVIGGRDSGGANGYTGFFTGLIYDVRIYDVALTAAQQVTFTGPPPPPPLVLGASVSPSVGGNPGQLLLTWASGGSLLESTNAAGPWTTNSAATPPYTVPITNSAEFYKVQFH